MSRERQEAGPSDTYLTEADGEGSMWDAFTSPSGGAQQEPTEPGAPKSDFHTSSRSRTRPAPLAGEKQSIKQVWLWRVRGVRRPKEAFIQDSALFQTSPEVATSGKQFLPPSLTHRGQGCYFEEDTISVCKTSCATDTVY